MGLGRPSALACVRGGRASGAGHRGWWRGGGGLLRAAARGTGGGGWRAPPRGRLLLLPSCCHDTAAEAAQHPCVERPVRLAISAFGSRRARMPPPCLRCRIRSSAETPTLPVPRPIRRPCRRRRAADRCARSSSRASRPTRRKARAVPCLCASVLPQQICVPVALVSVRILLPLASLVLYSSSSVSRTTFVFFCPWPAAVRPTPTPARSRGWAPGETPAASTTRAS